MRELCVKFVMSFFTASRAIQAENPLAEDLSSVNEHISFFVTFFVLGIVCINKTSDFPQEMKI